MKVINRTSHLIIAGGVMLVPSIPVECDYEELRARYPKLAEEEANGKLQVVSEEVAEKAKQENEVRTLKELKEYASKKGIDLKGVTSKADVLAAIKAAE